MVNNGGTMVTWSDAGIFLPLLFLIDTGRTPTAVP